MKKTITLLTIVAVIFLTQACKKEETSNNNTVADTYTGIWNFKDTSWTNSGALLSSIQNYNYIAEKIDASKILLLNFKGVDSTYFTVTASSMIYTSGATGSTHNRLVITNFVRTGNQITYHLTEGGSVYSGTAIKQ